MPMEFEPSREEVVNPNYHGQRRIYCDGCNLGMAWPDPTKWVYGEPQVASWEAEHKDHAPKKKGKG